MTYLHKVRLFFYHYFLQQELPDSRPKRKRVNLDSAQSIGVLFDATDPDAREVCISYAESLKKKNKKVSLLGYFDSTFKNSNFIFKHFNRRNIDWALRPKSEVVDGFISKSFDLMITLDTESKTYSEYIAALSKAHLRVGPFTENTYCYDLMIDKSGEQNLYQFIEQMELLLQKTNTNNEAA